MGELVRDDVGDELALVLGARGRVDQQQALAEGDAAEVLHRAGCEVGQGDQVDLVARVRDAVVVLEPAQAERSDVEAEVGQVALAGHVDESQRDAVDVDRVGGLEPADDERHQVAAHHHRVGEADHARPSAVVRSISGAFEIAVSPSSTSRVMANTALNSGSSQHGNARRQSVACIWVVAITCSMPSSSV